MVKKGFLKKTGCILISASIILAGWTFVGSSTSEADLDDDIVISTDEETPDDTLTDDDTEILDDVELNVDEEDNSDTAGGTVDDPIVPTAPPVDTDTEADAADDSSADAADLLGASLVQTPMMSLRSAPALLGSTSTSTTHSPDETEATYEGTTLVYVPAGVGSSFTVRAGTTSIATDAFSESDVRYLTFADGKSITSIASQNSWPKADTKVKCPNDYMTECGEIVRFFTGYGTVSLYFKDGEDDSYTVNITEVVGSSTYNLSYDMAEGQVIYPTNRPGYTCSDSYTVTTDANQSHTFTYTEAPGPATYTVTITEVFGDGVEILTYIEAAGTVIEPTDREDEGYYCTDTYTVTTDATQAHTFTYTTEEPQPVTTTITITEKADKDYTVIYKNLAAGTVISPTARSGYSCNDTYTVTDAAEQEHTFTYTASSTENTITITEKADKDYTIIYKNLNAGTVISPTARSGYSCSDKYTVTAEKEQTHTFTYTKNSGGGGGGGGGSSSGGSSSSGNPQTAAGLVNSVAQTTSKYVVTEGANQQVKQTDGAVRIVCNGPAAQLVYILFDGNKVSNTNYTIQSGSTILTFTKEYIASLPVGDHAVQFQYNDGYAITGLKILSPTAKTTTTVTYKVSADGKISAGLTKDTTPKTADGFDPRYMLCLAIFLMGAGSIMMGRNKKLEALLAEREEY